MDKQELLLHQLFQTVRVLTKGVNLVFEPYQLYSSEWSLLTTLKQSGPITQSDLATYLHIEPPAVSRTLATLEKKGLIVRTPGQDKRKKKVSLSAAALAHYDEWLETSRRHRESVLSGLSDDQQSELHTALTSIFRQAQAFGESKAQKEADSIE